jgi:uncharacterized membrane protein
MESANNSQIVKLPLLASLLALVGLADAIYLTVHHFSGIGSVQCAEGFGCEQVLTSKFAEIGGVPLALFGAAAYFTVFSLAVLAGFGNKRAWLLFGAAVSLMAVFSVWLIYLQAFVIQAFCQYCLLSAGVTFTMLMIFLVSRYFSKRLA